MTVMQEVYFRGCYSQEGPVNGAGPAYYAEVNSTSTFDNCSAERTIGSIFQGNSTIIRDCGIQWDQSNYALNLVDTSTRNVANYQWRTQTTTDAILQTLLSVPDVAHHNSSNRIVVVIQGKRNGNHASYLTATCVADRGVNNDGPQEVGADTWTVTTWGSENSLAGTTFDLNPAGYTNTVRVDNPPNYPVDWSITVQVTLVTP